MNIFVLSRSPKQLASELSDHHLYHTVEFSTRLINAALHNAWKDNVGTVYMQGQTYLQVPKHYIKGVQILPPGLSRRLQARDSTSMWVNWASARFNHAWWLFMVAWYCNREFKERFGVDRNHYLWDEFLVKWQNARLIAKLQEGDAHAGTVVPGYFPATPDVLHFENSLNPGENLHTMYIRYYIEVLKKCKARWTNRDVPQFWKQYKAQLVV